MKKVNEIVQPNYSTLSISIKSSKMDQELLNWLISTKNEPRYGSISVIDNETEKVIKKISFKSATSTGYSEFGDGLNSYSSEYRVSTFSIDFKEFTIKLN